MLKIYYAHPNFTLEQQKQKVLILEAFEKIKETNEIEIIDPFQINKDLDIKTQSEEIWENNIDAIEECDIVVADITYKDCGVCVEVGFATCNFTTIILIDLNEGQSTTNLMLSNAADSYIRNLNDFIECMVNENYSYKDLKGIIEE